MVNTLNEGLKAREIVRSNGGLENQISALKKWSEARLKANEGGEPGEISSSLTKIFEPWKSYMGEEGEEENYKIVTGDYTGSGAYSLNVEQDSTGKPIITELWDGGVRETRIWDNGIMVDVKQIKGPNIFAEVEVSENPESFYFRQNIRWSLQQAIENPPQFSIPEVSQIFNAAVGSAIRYRLPLDGTFVEEAVTVNTENGLEKSVEYYFVVSNEGSNRQGQGNREGNKVPEMQVSFYYRE